MHEEISTKAAANKEGTKCRYSNAHVNGVYSVREKEGPKRRRTPSRHHQDCLHSRGGYLLNSGNDEGDWGAAPGDLIVPVLGERVYSTCVRSIPEGIEAGNLRIGEMGKEVHCGWPKTSQRFERIRVDRPIIRVVKSRSVVCDLDAVV